ncbi:MAG: hypothetical protein D8M59_13115 [Planctomycetes bacterium]|nr:hypothetical protein [Planctomycetota bacterium]
MPSRSSTRRHVSPAPLHVLNFRHSCCYGTTIHGLPVNDKPCRGSDLKAEDGQQTGVSGAGVPIGEVRGGEGSEDERMLKPVPLRSIASTEPAPQHQEEPKT